MAYNSLLNTLKWDLSNSYEFMTEKLNKKFHCSMLAMKFYCFGLFNCLHRMNHSVIICEQCSIPMKLSTVLRAK